MMVERNGIGEPDAATSAEAPDATTALLDGDKPLVTPSGTDESTAGQPDVDWKTKLEEATATHTKAMEELQHKLDTAQGRAGKADQQDQRWTKMEQEIEETRVNIAGMPKLLKTLAKGISSGDSAATEAALDVAEAENQANRTQNLLLSRYNAKLDLFTDSLQGLGDHEERQTLWKAEEKRLVDAESQDMSGFDDLIFNARQAKIDEQLTTKDQEIETRLKQARAKWAEDAGVMDNDSGASAGGAPGDTSFIQNFGDPEKEVTPADTKRAIKMFTEKGLLK
jgi:hypothetical protein